MLATVNKQEWQSALESLRGGKADFLQRLTTLNAGGLAISISLLTGFQTKFGATFHAKPFLLGCWISLLVSIAFSLTYLCLHPFDSFNNKWSHLLKAAEEEAERVEKSEPMRTPGAMDSGVFVGIVRGWTEKSVNRFTKPLLFLYGLAAFFSVLGYTLLVLFAAKNLFAQ